MLKEINESKLAWMAWIFITFFTGILQTACCETESKTNMFLKDCTKELNLECAYFQGQTS